MRRHRHRVVATLAGALLCAGLAGVISRCGRQAPAEAAAAPSRSQSSPTELLRDAARPDGVPIVLLGLDGFDWVLLDRLIDAGRCPTFAAMKERGAWAEMVSHRPVLSPLIWTTMATGRRPEDHGILDFVVRDPASGRDVPITNQLRRVHAFWNVLSELGRRVNVVNWWATFPAEPVNGVMVSERPFYHLLDIGEARTDPANVHPPELAGVVLARLVAHDAISAAEIAEYTSLDQAEIIAELGLAEAADNPFDNRVRHLQAILASTHGVLAVGRWLLEDHPADLLALYIEGTDTVGHRFAHFLPPRLPWVSEEDHAAFGGVMERYYELVDRELGRLMAAAEPGTTWIVAADHGFYTGRARPGVPPDDFAAGAAKWHRMVGVFLVQGPHVRPGKIAHADINDLCPTMMWLQGAPISREIEGQVLTELMAPAWVEQHPPVFVDTYAGLPEPWKRPDVPLHVDDARLKELAALGYIDHSASAELAGGGSDLTETPNAIYNRGKLARRRGDLDAAIRHLEQTVAADPDHVFAMLELSAVHRQRRDPTQALAWLARAMQTESEHLPADLPIRFVRLAIAAGRLEAAAPILDQMPERWRATSSFATAQGLALRHSGREEEARQAFERALAVNPADLDALDALIDTGAGSEELLESAHSAARTDLGQLLELARLCLRRSQPERAEAVLRELLDSAPTDAPALMLLAMSHKMRGQLTEMVPPLERFLALQPDDTEARLYLALVLLETGRPGDALPHLEHARSLGLATPHLYAGLGQALAGVGRAADARQVLEEGLGRHPDNSLLQSALRGL